MKPALRFLTVTAIFLGAIGIDIPARAAGSASRSDSSILADINTAARGSDYAAFQLLLDRAERRADQLHGEFDRVIPLYEDVNRVWTFSRSDRIGSFLTSANASDLLRRLRRYDGFEREMDPFVIESNGARFYPAAEVRGFLADRARSGARREVEENPPSDSPRPARTAEDHVTKKPPPRRGRVGRATLVQRPQIASVAAPTPKKAPSPPAQAPSADLLPTPVETTSSVEPASEIPPPVTKAASPPESVASAPTVTTVATQTTPEAAIISPPAAVVPRAIAAATPRQREVRTRTTTRREFPPPSDGALFPIAGVLNDPKKSAKLSILIGLSLVSLAALSLLIRASRPERLLLTEGRRPAALNPPGFSA